ncbi:PstS family phosphate ABC transporter substrate-binding protein [Ureibacillus thermosphaericus]|uniref:PstS family phosphate ABC transporter substrate-binding protein n=1 Tax=Ureibacillus thermosphaericus TaxID=51173 RepID=UPI000304924A|nr:PstS family phosphate ABC transporter substrate-binding protein [Ureibacillus thermosphaericus]
MTNIFVSIIVFFVLCFFTFGVVFMALLMGNFEWIPFIIIFAIFLYLLFLAFLFRYFKTKKRIIWFVVISCVAISASSIWPIYQKYVENIPTVSAEVNIYEYMPFEENSKVVTLEEEATLQLSDSLPIMDGATALYPIYSSIAQATYPKKEYDPYNSEVMVNTTPKAYENLINGKVDMIFVNEPSQKQLQRAKEKGVELKLIPIGKEAFVFFVNQKNEVNGLTLQQIKDIYSGKITSWKEVGGKNEPIRAYQRPEDSGSQTALQSLMGDTPIMDAPRENVASGMGEIISEVAQYRNFENAIGYTFRYYSQEMVGNNQIKLLAIDGVPPTKETIRSGEYPITGEFYIVTAGTENPNVDKLIDWVLSPQGQQLIEKVGYVPINNVDE